MLSDTTKSKIPSARKQAEEERNQLLQREQQARQEAELEQMRLRSLFAQAPALIHILRGPDHVFEFFHPLGKELVGGRDLTGMKVREAVPEYEGQGYFELLDHVYQTGETYVGKEMRSLLKAADGTLIERFFDFIYQPWYDIDGKIAGILNFAVEVTDQVRARQQVEALAEALQRNQERLELAQEAGHIGTFEWNIQTNEVTWTKEEEALYGLLPGTFGGTQDHWVHTVHPDDLPNVQDAIERAIAGHHELDTTFRIIWPDQSVHWIYSKARPFYDTQGNPLRMIGVNMDITQRKEAEARKDEFISIASHEMKTPVASIKGFTQILHRLFSTRDDEQPLHFLARMDRQLDRLTKLINDLLDVSKMQTGKLEFQQELFDLDELIQETVENLQATTPWYQLTIEGITGAQLFGDRDRIGQVLINLLTNAIKYSPNTDKVIVRLTNEMSQVKVSVQDFGVGIADAHHQKIFERFYQATRPEDKTYPGLGIGLYISNEIIKRHHGRLWVESHKGAGATFSFTLPLSSSLAQVQENSG